MINSEEERIVRLEEIQKIIGLGRCTIKEMVKSGKFPKPFHIGKRSIGWKLSSINKWIDEKSKE
jgi:prophage regulatory protein